ncbi:MAG: hypothetical protein WEB60_05140 [Terrimicrobiaceae bacterium]
MNTNTPNPKPSESGLGAKTFLVTSLVFLVLASLMLAGRPNFLLTPVLTGHGLSWITLLLFGCGLSGIFGLVYMAFPKVFDIPLYSEKFVFLHYGFHLLGTLLALMTVLWPDFPRADMGATFLACGALVFVVNLSLTFRKAARPDLGRVCLSASMVWLLIMTFLGLPFTKEAPLVSLQGTDWSAAWLVFSFAGVVINTLMGLTIRILPRAMGLAETKNPFVWYALIFCNAGVAWMFPAITFRSPGFLILCGAIYLIGAVLYLLGFLVALQRSQSLPWDGKILLTSFSLIPVAACLLVFSAVKRLAPAVVPDPALAPDPALTEAAVVGPLPVEFLPVDGAVFLLSALAVMVPIVVALLFQYLRIERDVTLDSPTPKSRLSDLILLASYFNYATGVLLVVPGAWVGIERIVSLGTLFLLVGSFGFLGNYLFSSSRRQLPTPEVSHPLQTAPQ